MVRLRGRLRKEEKDRKSLSPRDRKSPSPPPMTTPPKAVAKPIPEPSPQFEKRYEDIAKLSKGNLGRPPAAKSVVRDFPSRKEAAVLAPKRPGANVAASSREGKPTGTGRTKAAGGDRFDNFMSQENAFQTSRKALSTSQIEKNMEKRLDAMAIDLSKR